MSRKGFIIYAVMGLSLISLADNEAMAEIFDKGSKPLNIVAIVTDDQSDWAMGAYGNCEVQTPSMDRIAEEGILFTNSFVLTPVCSPSRATYLSGLYPTQNTITDFLDENEDFGEKMGFNSLTWPALLREHGYVTALVGKWDLGLLPRYFPTRHGFDHFFGYLSDSPAKMNPRFKVNNDFVETAASRGGGGDSFPRSEINGQLQQFEGALPDVLTSNAMAFMKANKDKPFALLLHYQAPHTPWLPVPEQDLAHYTDLDPNVPEFKDADVEKLKRLTKEHYAAVSAADRNIGRVLDFLDEHKLTGNTLVIFTSDNGYAIGHHHILGKGNGRWTARGITGPIISNMWENSIRVPLAMRWPGVINPGSRTDHMISNLDIFRTILGALNVPVPEDSSVRGTDFSPLLRDEAFNPPDAIFGQYDCHNIQLSYLRMIRTKKWKYIQHFHTNFMNELYDLENDPEESRNLMTRKGPRKGSIKPATFMEMKDRLREWMQSIDDPLLKDSY
jgi:arylsulfatase A-like enzyme